MKEILLPNKNENKMRFPTLKEISNLLEFTPNYKLMEDNCGNYALWHPAFSFRIDYCDPKKFRKAFMAQLVSNASYGSKGWKTAFYKFLKVCRTENRKLPKLEENYDDLPETIYLTDDGVHGNNPSV